jgi:hypothetical protein
MNAFGCDRQGGGDRLDRPDPIYWDCQLYDANGTRMGDGCAHTAAEAMALAWLCCWTPDALVDRWVGPDAVPFEIAC